MMNERSRLPRSGSLLAAGTGSPGHDRMPSPRSAPGSGWEIARDSRWVTASLARDPSWTSHPAAVCLIHPGGSPRTAPPRRPPHRVPWPDPCLGPRWLWRVPVGGRVAVAGSCWGSGCCGGFLLGSGGCGGLLGRSPWLPGFLRLPLDRVARCCSLRPLAVPCSPEHRRRGRSSGTSRQQSRQEERQVAPQRPRVFVSRRLPGDAVERLAAAAEVEVWPERLPPPPAALARHAAGADGLLLLLTDRVDAALLERCPRLRVVANMAVGY